MYVHYQLPRSRSYNLFHVLVYDVWNLLKSQQGLKCADFTAIDALYLRAAGLHLRLSAFFDSPTSKDYHEYLRALWFSTSSFLECAFNLHGLRLPAGGVLIYATNYILQMIIAAGFTLLKLLNSFFAHHIDFEYGRQMFNRTIWAIRSISVTTNDLPSRLAEVLAQLWKGSAAGQSPRNQGVECNVEDSSLQLKVKCRMSMSLVYDSVWRWREEFQAQGRGNLECLFAPTRVAFPLVFFIKISANPKLGLQI